jgi:23S rRNA pseudouridine1911/1915/1917 synthase
MYLALVEGIVEPREGIIDAPIGRSKTDRKKMAVVREGRSARTRYRVRQIFRQPDLSLVEAYPETGRTHQIRVHFAWLKHPLVGDEVYGRQRSIVLIVRHFLHAAALTLTLPNGETHTFESKLPDDLQGVLDQLTAAEK